MVLLLLFDYDLFIINLFVDKLRFLGIYQILYLDANKINSSKSCVKVKIVNTIKDKNIF